MPPASIVVRARGLRHRYDGTSAPRKGGGKGMGTGEGRRGRTGGGEGSGPKHRAGSGTGRQALALDGVSLELEAGTVTALLGPNGSGKSTLARILAGRLKPSEGRVCLLGIDDPTEASAEIRRRTRASVVHLDQDLALDPEMTGAETLELLAVLEGLGHEARQERIDELVSTFELDEPRGRAVAKSSGGQRRRLHLAAALLGEPSLLVVDEPSAGLDAEGRKRLWALLRARSRAGAAVLILSHDLERIEAHADRAFLLHGGRLVADGPPPTIVRKARETRETRGERLSSGGREGDRKSTEGRPESQATLLPLGPTPGIGLGSGAVAAWALCRRTWQKTFRRPVVLTFSLVQPLVWMAFFGFLFQRFDLGTTGEIRYLDFLAPGVCAMTVLFGASQSGIGWIRDLHTGFLHRLLGTPSSPGAILAGKILADVFRLLAQSAAVLGLALLLGARLRFELALLPGVLGLLLFATAFSSLSCAIALRTRAQEAMAAFVHVVNMPLLFTSTALVPERQMPEWLATVARYNPLSHAVDGLRGAMLEGIGPSVDSLLLLAVVAVGLYFVASREMSRLQRDPG